MMAYSCSTCFMQFVCFSTAVLFWRTWAQSTAHTSPTQSSLCKVQALLCVHGLLSWDYMNSFWECVHFLVCNKLLEVDFQHHETDCLGLNTQYSVIVFVDTGSEQAAQKSHIGGLSLVKSQNRLRWGLCKEQMCIWSELHCITSAVYCPTGRSLVWMHGPSTLGHQTLSVWNPLFQNFIWWWDPISHARLKNSFEAYPYSSLIISCRSHKPSEFSLLQSALIMSQKQLGGRYRNTWDQYSLTEDEFSTDNNDIHKSRGLVSGMVLPAGSCVI